MLKKLKDSWKYSGKNDKIEFFAVFIAIAFLIAFLIYVVYVVFTTLKLSNIKIDLPW